MKRANASEAQRRVRIRLVEVFEVANILSPYQIAAAIVNESKEGIPIQKRVLVGKAVWGVYGAVCR